MSHKCYLWLQGSGFSLGITVEFLPAKRTIHPRQSLTRLSRAKKTHDVFLIHWASYVKYFSPLEEYAFVTSGDGEPTLEHIIILLSCPSCPCSKNLNFAFELLQFLWFHLALLWAGFPVSLQLRQLYNRQSSRLAQNVPSDSICFLLQICVLPLFAFLFSGALLKKKKKKISWSSTPHFRIKGFNITFPNIKGEWT